MVVTIQRGSQHKILFGKSLLSIANYAILYKEAPYYIPVHFVLCLAATLKSRIVFCAISSHVHAYVSQNGLTFTAFHS